MKFKISDTDYKLSSDKSLGVPQPPFQKNIPENAPILNLPRFYYGVHKELKR
jgi:hypothetical protein